MNTNPALRCQETRGVLVVGRAASTKRTASVPAPLIPLKARLTEGWLDATAARERARRDRLMQAVASADDGRGVLSRPASGMRYVPPDEYNGMKRTGVDAASPSPAGKTCAYTESVWKKRRLTTKRCGNLVASGSDKQFCTTHALLEP
jgi:hypothetical protein